MKELRVPLHHELEAAKLRLFLKRWPELATLMAEAYLQENLQLRQEGETLRKQLTLAEIRSCEAQLNAYRQEMNAWAMFLLLVEQGGVIAGFENLRAKDCRKRIVDLQRQCQDLTARAGHYAARIGCVIRYGTEGGRVQMRLQAITGMEVLKDGQ